MTRNIRYKPISKDLEKMVKPIHNSHIRASVGLEGSIGEFYYISVDDLVPYHNQSRKIFDEEEINLLAESIKMYGVRQPLTVLSADNNKYEVVSGERRLRAAKQAGLNKVPCIIIDNNQADAIALIENIHRKNLHPLELANTYKNLLEGSIFSSQSELSLKISVAKSHISEYLKYADLPEEIQKQILNNKITSRDRLRKIIKAYENNDNLKVRELVGLSIPVKNNKSLVRVLLVEGKIKIQDKGLINLDKNERIELKKLLVKLIEQL